MSTPDYSGLPPVPALPPFAGRLARCKRKDCGNVLVPVADNRGARRWVRLFQCSACKRITQRRAD